MRKAIFFLILFSFSCSSKFNHKNEFYEKGGVNEARINAINDFAENSPLFKKDLVFSISESKLDSSLIVISILGDVNKLYPTIRNKTGTSSEEFPTRYFEKKRKLFYWYDPNYTITHELISKLSEYKHIDSSLVNKDNTLLADYVVDDSKKGEDYYFCKDNLKNFKKVRTSIGTGYYPIPDVDCSK